MKHIKGAVYEELNSFFLMRLGDITSIKAEMVGPDI